MVVFKWKLGRLKENNIVTNQNPLVVDKWPCHEPSQYHCTYFPLEIGMYLLSHILTWELQICFLSKATEEGEN